MRYVGICILFLISLTAYSQSVAHELSLDKVLDTLSLRSPATATQQLSCQNEILRFKNYKKGYLPSVSLSLSPISFNRSLRVLQNPIDGSYSYVEDYSNNSGVGITVNQKVLATGGQLSFNSSLNYLNEFSQKRSSFSSTPFSFGYSQQLFGGFQVLFARHHNSIVQKLEETQKSDKKDVPPSWINVAYYLVATQKLLPRHDYEQLFSRILQACEGVIIESLQNIRRGVPSDKASLQRMLVRYLEVAQHTQFFTPSHSILQTYCKLYADEKFVNNFWIGWYLQQITEKQGAYGEVAGQNIEVGLPFLKADNLSLSECVKLLTVLQTWGSHSCCDAKIDELCIKLFPDKGAPTIGNELFYEALCRVQWLPVTERELPVCYYT